MNLFSNQTSETHAISSTVSLAGNLDNFGNVSNVFSVGNTSNKTGRPERFILRLCGMHGIRLIGSMKK